MFRRMKLSHTNNTNPFGLCYLKSASGTSIPGAISVLQAARLRMQQIAYAAISSDL